MIFGLTIFVDVLFSHVRCILYSRGENGELFGPDVGDKNIQEDVRHLY